MPTPLPHPNDDQITAVRITLLAHKADAADALAAGDDTAYIAALDGQRVCQSWLDTYVDNRKDAA